MLMLLLNSMHHKQHKKKNPNFTNVFESVLGPSFSHWISNPPESLSPSSAYHQLTPPLSPMMVFFHQSLTTVTHAPPLLTHMQLKNHIIQFLNPCHWFLFSTRLKSVCEIDREGARSRKERERQVLQFRIHRRRWWLWIAVIKGPSPMRKIEWECVLMFVLVLGGR